MSASTNLFGKISLNHQTLKWFDGICPTMNSSKTLHSPFIVFTNGMLSVWNKWMAIINMHNNKVLSLEKYLFF